MCFINGVSLIIVIDIGATHLFISLDCVNKLNLELSSIIRSMVIDTLTNGSVTISLVCLNCPLTIYSKDFGVDLICLPLSQLDVILRMRWLDFNRVYINYLDKNVLFAEPEESNESSFMSTDKVEMYLREDDHVLVMFSF